MTTFLIQSVKQGQYRHNVVPSVPNPVVFLQYLIILTNMENRLLRVGDLITIQINSRGHSFSLFSQGFYPSSLNLCLTPQLEPIHNCFLIYRKSIDYDHKSLDEEGGNREPINYDEVILLKHYISQKFLCIRESDTSIMQLHLRTSLGPECEFKLLPLFKCQTVNSRRVRQE
jgi:hypothetical protein